MRLLMRGDPDTVIRWAGMLLLGAMIGGVVCARLDLPGIISCMFAGALGAAGGSFVQYRTDRGLWMLAVLFFVLYCGIYAMMAIGQIGDILRNAAPAPVSVFVDATIGTVLLSTNLRFLYRVGRTNWAVSQLDT